MNDTSWESVTDRQRDRLLALAESANETARMARVNVSLTLIGALYLMLTLLTATDENLLKDSIVTLPQFEIGISLSSSYLFGPIVFLYLHLQSLFLLAVLARKVRRFEDTVLNLFSRNTKAEEECRDWLSAVSLVQGLIIKGRFAHFARVLAWLSIAGIPLLLLLLIDISFLRYQSDTISVIHHLCFCADLVGVWLFWLYVRTPRSTLAFSNLLEAKSRFERTRYSTEGTQETPAWSLSKLILLLCSVALPAFLWGYSLLPYNPNEKSLVNALCPPSQWRGACRALSVPSGSELVDIGLERRSLQFANLSGSYLENVRFSESNMLGANLRAADLKNVDMTLVNLSRAHLFLANLTAVNLTGASLRSAEMSGATLTKTVLKGAILQEADLHGADLTGADFVTGEAHTIKRRKIVLFARTNLRRAKLTKTILVRANLTGADLTGADLTGADLTGADLTGAELTGADLTGAVVTQTQLDAACGDKHTRLPDRFTIPTCGEQ